MGGDSLLIRGGRVIDPASGYDAWADVLIREGRIVAVGGDLVGADVPVLDSSNLIVCPGFVDLHTHLRYPGFPEKETIRTGTMAAAAGGFTTVCAMANTHPVVDSVEVLENVRAAAEREGVARVHQLAAVSCGLLGEQLTDMAALAAAGAPAFSDDGKPVWNENIMRQALRQSRALHLPISVHEEDPELVRGGVANAGDRARRQSLAEWPCAGEASMVARDVRLLGEEGGHLHVAHVSCADTVRLIREAKARGLRITAEATPHHLRLTDRLLEGDAELGLPPAHPCTKVNPPLRCEADVEALVEALADGTIDAVATDHAPHTASDKDMSYEDAAFGISAVESALPLLLDLVRERRLDLVTLVERLTAGPARAFGLHAGTLAPGEDADICVFDPVATWRLTPEAMVSRGKNTPLMGSLLRGRVVWTLVDGRVVWPSPAQR